VVADNQFGSVRLQPIRPRRLCVPSTKTVPGANHYRCYRVRTEAAPAGRVALKDQFLEAAEEVELGVAEFVCAPVDKDGSGIPDPAVHHVAYPFQAGYPPRVAILDNQFGAFKFAFERAGWLFVPSQKLAVDGDPVDLPLTGPADHYKAYVGGAEPCEPRPVTLTDQFDGGPAAIGPPTLLLAPGDKNGGGIADEATHYLGYPFVEPQGTPRAVVLNNQFGDLMVRLEQPSFLLVPSRKTAVDAVG
jgi:hypothetical protein